MSAIIFGYLAMSYTFSGLVCCLATLKNSSHHFPVNQLSKYPDSFANLFVTFLWPIWVWHQIHKKRNLTVNPIYCSDVFCRSFATENSSFGQKQGKRFQQDNLTKIRIKIQVSQKYQTEPVISCLTSDYGLIFNITDALLKGGQEDGIFHLELFGTPQQIQKALDYLLEKEVKIWGKANADRDSW